MQNDYLDSLVKDLEKQGIVNANKLNLQPEDKELKVIMDMEELLGVKYSDEQKTILKSNGNSVILACAGSGKALVNGTKVLTSKGYKSIEKLEVGNIVYDHLGQEQKVLGIFPQGLKKVHKVYFNTGDIINCCRDHLWTVKNKNDLWEVCDTDSLMHRLNTKSEESFEIPNTLKVSEFCEEYTCSPSYRNLLMLELPTYDEIVGLLQSSEEDSKAYQLTLDLDRGEPWTWLYELCECGIYNILKSDRLKEIFKKAYDFFGLSTCFEKVENYEAKESIIDELKQYKSVHRSIVKIECINSLAPMTCIKVSGMSELFLTEHCIPTHNTTISTHLIAKRLQTGEIPDVSKLIYATYNKAGATEMQTRLTKILSRLGFNYNVQVKTIHAFFYHLVKTFGVNFNVIEDSYRYRIIGEACKEVGFSIKDDNVMQISNLLSYQINNMLSDKKTMECMYNTIEDLTLEQYTKIRMLYAAKKQQAKLIDYDDMQTYLYVWMCKWKDSDKPNEAQLYKDIINYCQYMYHDFYIDEAQDVSKLQFEILKAMITQPEDNTKLKAKLTFIGDDDQCLIEGTQVTTSDGIKNIEDIRVGDKVRCASGGMLTFCCKVKNVSKRKTSEKIYNITTSGGHKVSGTYNHVAFAKPSIDLDKYYVCLMYSPEIGFELGYFSGDELISNKISERYTKVWSLYDYINEGDAQQKTSELMQQYNLVGKGEGNTKRGLNFGLNLIADSDCMLRYPNIVTDLSKANKGVRYTLFAHDGCYHLMNNFEDGTSTCYDSMKDIEQVVNSLQNSASEHGELLDIECRFDAGCNMYHMINFGALRVGMHIPVVDYRGIVHDEEITEITSEQYTGFVYDLSIPKSRNFIANGIVVHNCIYEWRGSNPSIIQCIGSEFNINTYVLSTNYRCKNEIVDYATAGVKNNSRRYEKGMNAFVQGGSVKILPVADSEKDLYNISKAALNHIKYWINSGTSLSEIAVLSRNNRHLTILNSLLLRNGIYCNCTEDMKVTRGTLYQDVKMLVEMCEPSQRCEILKKMLWKFEKYMGVANCNAIGTFMNNSSLTIEDTLGYLVKTYVDKTIKPKNNPHINMEADAQIQYTMNKLTLGVKNSLLVLYQAITCSTPEERFKALINLYLVGATGSIYKTIDKYREARGLLNFLNEMCKEEGFRAMKDFLRILEQFEKGTMGVMGEKITLSTIHSAKGREWKNVIMFACDNISEPNFDTISKMSEDENTSIHDIFSYIDEERRLFYVGNTRAKENLLVLTSPNTSVFILECLGAHIGNDKIIEYSNNKDLLKEYNELIEEKIKNTKSKYYYDIKI